MLTIDDLKVNYGGIQALKGVSLKVTQGSIVTLIGANGAGKSTLLRTVVGLVPAAAGAIRYMGNDIGKLRTMDIIRRGIVLIPEGRRVFPNLTIEENLVLGAYPERNRKVVQQDMKIVFDLFPRLHERRSQKAGTLSGGEQQMLAVGRGLMAKPKLLMMDEPSLGLAPLVVKDIFRTIERIRSLDVTILLIEQNAKAALEVADYGYVLETGTIRLQGNGADLLNNDDVKKSYLGIA